MDGSAGRLVGGFAMEAREFEATIGTKVTGINTSLMELENGDVQIGLIMSSVSSIRKELDPLQDPQFTANMHDDMSEKVAEHISTNTK